MRNYNKYCTILLAFLYLGCIQSSAQFHVQIHAQNDTITLACNDSLSCATQAASLQEDYISRGFLLCDFKHSFENSQEQFWQLESGEQYAWGNLELGVLTQEFGKLPFPEDAPVNPSLLQDWMQDVLIHFENNGHPFAQIRTSDASLNQEQISIKVEIDPGNTIRYDSLIIRSEDNWKTHYFRNYLNLRKGRIYKEKDILSCNRKLEMLPFVSTVKSTEVVFSKDEADVYLYLKKVPTNQFNGIIGLQQNAEDGKTTITGQLDLLLTNTLGRGEVVQLKWRRLQTASQELKSKLSYPYILGSDLGVDGELEIYRQDSTYGYSRRLLGVLYQFQALDHVKAFVETRSSSDFNMEAGSKNVKTTSYGIGGKINRFDRLINPSKGWNLNGKVSVGNRVTQGENADKLLQTKAQLDLSVAFKIRNQFTLILTNKGRTLTGNNLFENEMFLMGGFDILRGFDEASIKASSLWVGSTELRWRFDTRSYLYGFFDQGWFEKKSELSYTRDIPRSFGIGTSLETGGGIFNIAYATGSMKNEKLLLKNAKIHFGFTSIF